MPTKASRAVNHQYFIRSPTKRTFDALTNPKILVKWLADRAELTPRKGGSYLLSWNGGPTHTGTVIEFRPGKSIALSWAWPGVTLQGTVFRLSVTPKGRGSILSVEHTGFPKSDRWADLYGGAEWGWTYFALNLRSVLETGRDFRSKYDG